MGRQRGFSLVELLAVMAIVGVLAGVVSGSVSELGASGQFAQIRRDTKTMEMAADWFFSASSPQKYPVKNPDTNGDGILDVIDFPSLPARDVNVRIIDFRAGLPQDPTRTFAPDFIKQIPNSSAIISYRVDTATGDVFAATRGAPLVPPSELRLDVAVAGNSTGGMSDVTFDMLMSKNRAAVEVLKIQIPPGYVVGGRSLSPGVAVGNLDIFFDVDNPWRPGHVLKVSAPVLTTGRAHEWEVSPDYSKAKSQANGDVVNTVKGTIQSDGITRRKGPILTHTIDVFPATDVTPGAITLEMDLSGEFNRRITNPSKAAVYHWAGKVHSTIQVDNVFEPAVGNQAVVIQEFSTAPAASPSNSPPAVDISSQSGATFMVGNSMLFVGSAVDAEDGDLTGELVWT